ncbi:Phospholipase D1 [Coemansia sp. S2]|nr:Phospholipase D1 [Coemansia sp. S2]KAJ2071362.1 Phospholipase D1 [Coemansia sp. S155-1]KAJ2351274.1 Phospholipase D1 [Coemansia sp. RSA 2673]
MHGANLIVVAALLLGLGEQVHANTCRAQNILDACLSMQNKQFKMCDYDNWECKCHSQKKILTCYDNCPDAENRTLQEMQVQIYCAALGGREFNSEMMDRMTRPARIVVDDQPPPTQAAMPQAPPPPPPPPPVAPPRNNDEWGAAGRGGASGQAGGNVVVVNDNAATPQQMRRMAWTASAVIALGMLAMI